MSILLGMASMSVIAVISDAIGNHFENMDFGANYFFSAVFVLFVLGLTNDLFLSKMVAHVSYDIQIEMIRRVLATPLAQLERIGLPKVIATLTEDMNTAEKFFHVLPVLTVNITIVLCGIAYMAYLSSKLLIVVFGFLLAGTCTIGGLLWYTKKDRVEMREATDTMMKHYQDVVLGAKELRLHSPRKYFFTRKIFSTAADIRRHSRSILNVLALIEQWAQLLVFAMLGGIIFLAGNFIPLSAEIIAGYIITLLFLLEPIEVITNSSDELVDAKVAFDKIDRLGLTQVQQWNQQKTPENIAIDNCPGIVLELDNIQYSYTLNVGEKNQTFHLGPIFTQFRSGNITLIHGGNGSGKSTLLKILCGLYAADTGTIRLNGKRVGTDEIKNFRNHFSIIAPDFCLFEDILDRQGSPCDDSIIHKQLEKLGLSRAVSVNSARLSTLNLSNGQRKRLALLQAYCEDRPILLLDEWAADQDPAFKAIFYQEILPTLKAQGKIVIVVSHDERYFDCADKVLKIEDGKLHESESHAPTG